MQRPLESNLQVSETCLGNTQPEQAKLGSARLEKNLRLSTCLHRSFHIFSGVDPWEGVRHGEMFTMGRSSPLCSQLTEAASRVWSTLEADVSGVFFMIFSRIQPYPQKVVGVGFGGSRERPTQ